MRDYQIENKQAKQNIPTQNAWNFYRFKPLNNNKLLTGIELLKIQRKYQWSMHVKTKSRREMTEMAEKTGRGQILAWWGWKKFSYKHIFQYLRNFQDFQDNDIITGVKMDLFGGTSTQTNCFGSMRLCAKTFHPRPQFHIYLFSRFDISRSKYDPGQA